MIKSSIFKLAFLLIFIMGTAMMGTGCENDSGIPKPEKLIEEDIYIDLLVEMQLVNTYERAGTDSLNTDSLKREVFKKYNVKQEHFKATHQYYQSQAREHKKRIEQAIERLESEKIKLIPPPDSAYTDSSASTDK